jgi:hypothetical protein
MTPSVLYLDLGEPDDPSLQTCTYNFDVYSIFRLNLMVMEENKIIPMGSNHYHVTITMTLENLMTSLQTYNILLLMQLFA